MGSHHRVAGAGLSLALVIGLSGGAAAGQADVLKAEISRQADGNYRIAATLLHPHVDEQPFTRSLSGIHIPPTWT